MIRPFFSIAARGAIVLAILAAGCGQADESATPPVHPVDASAEEAAALDAPAEADTAEPACVPTTCAKAGVECGSIPDGCGGKLSCGTCPNGLTCGGDGPNQCGTGECSPKTCAQLGAACGFVSDGCSEAIDCGGCPAPSTCGGGSATNQCGCKPKGCVALGATCGTAPDGCGGIVDCGTCSQGQICGGAGPNKCGTGACSPKTCAQLSASCGVVSDLCSQAIACGDCTLPSVCGGQGVANQCGCAAKTCAQLGASCGTVESGCGHPIDCGTCPSGLACGGGGVANQCGCSCTLPHAKGACVDGGCAVGSCDAGWGDCDSDPSNGCETDLSSHASHCGACNKSCDDSNACTVGDACVASVCVPGALKACSAPPNVECYEAAGSCEPSTGNCTYPTKPDNTTCGATTCPSWGACQWASECSNSGTQHRNCTDHKCSAGACGAVVRAESQGCSRTIANGTSCSGGYCCSNSCVAKNAKAHCGSCGVDCGSQSCVLISGTSEYTCTCPGSNAFCQGAGFGGIATCYTANGQTLCNCQCPSGTSCTGQCAGGGTCSDTPGHNYCHY